MRVSLTLALALFAFSASAQEMGAAEMREGVTYHQVTHFKFHPGKSAEGIAIMRDHLLPASLASGTNVVLYETLVGGDWDVVSYFEMGDDMEELTWKTSPSEMRFRAQLVRDLGGIEEVGELYGRYLPLLADEHTEIVMTQD